MSLEHKYGSTTINGMTSVMSGEDYEKLTKIAPTVADSKNYPDFSTPWQELARTAARSFITADPIYQRLDVARTGRAVFVEDKLLVDALVAGT
ncbi:MAG: hypothetical protein ACT4NY_01705 [Pseudonocardiales bacterium]